LGLIPEQADLVLKTIDEIRGKKDLTREPSRVGGEQTIPELEQRPAAKISRKSSAGKKETPEISKGVAEFVFSPADEAEILAVQKKISKVPVVRKQSEINKIINDAIKASGIVLDDAGRKKLENILLTNFLDVRDSFETQSTLSDIAGRAGLNLSAEQIFKLLGFVKNKIGELEATMKEEAIKLAEKGIVEEKLKANQIGEEVLETVKSKIDERWQQITKRPAVASINVPSELIAPPAAMQAKVSTIAPPRPATVPEKQFAQVPVATIEKKPLKIAGEIPLAIRGPVAPGEEPKPLQIIKTAVAPARRPAPPPDNRPRLDDVKYVPKLVGPIEELREMTIVDFRRLDQNPELAAAKIKEKIRLLEKESITKKISGIKAWQESEVSNLYLEISRESLGEGKPVGQVISSRLSSGKPTLTEIEYRAVMSLNRFLRY
jgi:hypothetical protein